ncbi:MAG: hypothetical protein P1P84_15870 [Deferrisomatales bacterium]|nr:hypothetical protein [Deferrisomatales bacterium]
MNTRMALDRIRLSLAVLLVGLGAAACGGGGGGGGGGDTPAATTTVTGSAFAAPLQGGAVTVHDGTGSVIAGPVTTADDGRYAVDVPTAVLASELFFRVSGGSFTDEATGQPTPLAGSDGLAAVAAAGSLGAGGAVHLDPATTVVHHLVANHGLSRAAARLHFRNAFGFTPDSTVAPANTGTAALVSRLAGLRAAAFSRLTLDLGLAPGAQFALLEALARDLADSDLDGEDAGGEVPIAGAARFLPADVQNRFEHALLGFLDSGWNQTGLGPEQVGYLAFAKVALTTSYRVEYLPVAPGAAVGRTPFRLSVTRRGTGAPVAGLAVSLQPVMHMAAYDHATPWEPVTDNGDGTYTGAVYYSMPGGEGLGTWSLGVDLAAGAVVETAIYHPVVSSLNVNMAVLRGQDDQIQGSLGPAARPYYLFDAGLALEGGTPSSYRFDLFVAAQESDRDYPGLALGSVLHDAGGAPWTVTEAVVEVSLDADDNDVPDGWYTASGGAGGLWSVAGMTGIAPDSETLAFFVRLRVNGEQKTANGNDYAKMVMGGASCCE